MIHYATWSQGNDSALMPTLTAPSDPGYFAFKGAFGGWTLAHAMTAAIGPQAKFTDDAAIPLTATIDFLRGIGEGPVISAPQVTSETKSARFFRITTSHADNVCASTSFIVSRRRPTDHVAAQAMPECALPESLPAAQFPPTPNTWLGQFEMRIAEGKPLKPNPHMRSLFWTKFRDGAPLDFFRLAALADASLPRIFFHYPELSPISTVTMTVHFHASAADLNAIASDFVLIESSSQIARSGFYDQCVRLWSRSGNLLATSTQMAWFNVSTAQ